MDPSNDSPEREILALLKYLRHSPWALGFIAALVGLVVLEFIFGGFRDFGTEHPLAVGTVVSLLFVALGAVVVDLYLGGRDRQREKEEQERALETWDPIADRIVRELEAPLLRLATAVNDARQRLWEAEVGHTVPDRAKCAQGIEDALDPLRSVLDAQMSVLLLTPRLSRAARYADEARRAAEYVAQEARQWKSVSEGGEQGGGRPFRLAIEIVVNRERWFKKSQPPPDEIPVEVGTDPAGEGLAA